MKTVRGIKYSGVRIRRKKKESVNRILRFACLGGAENRAYRESPATRGTPIRRLRARRISHVHQTARIVATRRATSRLIKSRYRMGFRGTWSAAPRRSPSGRCQNRFEVCTVPRGTAEFSSGVARATPDAATPALCPDANFTIALSDWRARAAAGASRRPPPKPSAGPTTRSSRPSAFVLNLTPPPPRPFSSSSFLSLPSFLSFSIFQEELFWTVPLYLPDRVKKRPV